MPLKTISLLFVFAALAVAQPLGVGVKLGVPATDAFDVVPIPTFTPLDADQRPFIFGPYVELRLPASLAIEFDALYRSFRFRSETLNESASAWEFPVLLKYRFRSGLVRPYVEGGPSFRSLQDFGFSTLKNKNNYGLVLGAGLEFNLLLFKVAPEVRYTGWTLKELDTQGVESRRNQLTVLFSVGF